MCGHGADRRSGNRRGLLLRDALHRRRGPQHFRHRGAEAELPEAHAGGPARGCRGADGAPGRIRLLRRLEPSRGQGRPFPGSRCEAIHRRRRGSRLLPRLRPDQHGGRRATSRTHQHPDHRPWTGRGGQVPLRPDGSPRRGHGPRRLPGCRGAQEQPRRLASRRGRGLQPNDDSRTPVQCSPLHGRQ